MALSRPRDNPGCEQRLGLTVLALAAALVCFTVLTNNVQCYLERAQILQNNLSKAILFELNNIPDLQQHVTHGPKQDLRMNALIFSRNRTVFAPNLSIDTAPNQSTDQVNRSQEFFATMDSLQSSPSIPIKIKIEGHRSDVGKAQSKTLAVVVAGQVRTLKAADCSIQKHVLDILIQDNFTKINFFAAVEKMANGPDIHMLSGRQLFNHKQVKIFDIRPYFGENCFASCARHIHQGALGARYCDELLSQIYYRDFVADMIDNFERHHGMRHDLILLLRTDTIYIRPLPRSSLVTALNFSNIIVTPSWHQWGGLNDRFMISGHRGGMHYLRMFRGMCKRTSNQTYVSGNLYDLPWTWSSHAQNFESLLRLWVESGGFEAPKQLEQFFMYRVRMETGLKSEGGELAGGMPLANMELKKCVNRKI